jgi:iron complex outermembrane recepter protein
MKLRTLVSSLALLGLTSHVSAQTAEPQRVEITGSSIKRIQSEGALPIQTISREEIERAGVSSAEQLVARLSANGNGLDNMVALQGGDFFSSNSGNRQHNNGAAGVSLRGLGAQYTLVLLNGRRLSTHGLNGQSVDLNQIPIAAIDRVEILKDGASAIYGTDAVGGVMNFILRKDYTGLEAGAFADVTQHGGGNIGRASLLFGAGTLDADGYNLTASLAYKTNTRLRGSQRTDFHNGNQPGRGMTQDTSGTPYATISAINGTALPRAAGSSFVFFPGDSTGYNEINALALQGKCDSVAGMSPYRADITGITRRNRGCTWDYGGQWSLLQPVDALNFVGKGSWALGKAHTAFVEATVSQVKSATEYTPIQLTSGAVAYPASGPYFQNLATLLPTLFKPTNTDANDKRVFFDATKAERIRWRCLECGPRQQDTTTDAYRLLTGTEGTLAEWDYKWGLSTGQSKAKTKLGDGNMYIDKINAAMATGKINPFLLPGQAQTAEGLALIEGAKAKGASLYGGKAQVTELDATFSRELFKMAGGAASGAFGVDLRRETYAFDSSPDATANINGTSAPAALAKAKRNISAVFGELQLPLIKDLELQLAARYDKYSDFGSTTNPKAGLLWRVLPQLSLRGSYSRGFHAPDYDSLYGGATFTGFNTDINDPLLCPNGVETVPGQTNCGIRPEIGATSNPKLKAERSKQLSFGFVAQPSDALSATVDFWRIDLTDRIGALTGLAVVSNYAQYSQYVLRDPATNQIVAIQSPALNLAGDKTSGVDLSLTAKTKTAIGDITASLEGTYVDSYKSRFSKADAWSERVSKFGDPTFGYDLHARWKHTASMSWTQGDWSATFSQQYTAGYEDEVNGYSADPPIILSERGFQKKVGSYTLYNVAASWKGIKNLTVTAGIKNLLDTAPPFSYHNVDNVAGAGWDARVGDPRGRSFTLGVNYKFF